MTDPNDVTGAESWWDRSQPFFIHHQVSEADIDGFRHVNNSIYLQWMDRCVWAHTDAVGLSAEICLELNRGMAAMRHEIDYLAPARLGEDVVIANWVTKNDGRLRAERRFQIVRLSDCLTLVRAKTDYVCTNLKTGRPARMPERFHASYPVIAA